MIDLQTGLVNQTPFFNKLAAYWQQATQGQLLLFGPTGDLLKSYANLPAAQITQLGAYLERNDDPDQPVKHSFLVLPLLADHQCVGYIASVNTPPSFRPVLQLMADVIQTDLPREQALEGITDELITAWDQLELVYQITKIFSEETNLTDALSAILQAVIRVFKVESGFILYNVDDHVQCVSVGEPLQGAVCSAALLDQLVGQPNVIFFNHNAEVQAFWSDFPTDIASLMAARIQNMRRVQAAIGLCSHNRVMFVAADVKLMTAVAEQIGAIVDNLLLQQELIAQERVQRELEIAAEIQNSLQPTAVPTIEGLGITVVSRPAYEVGGDFYDIIETDNDYVTFVLGDVAGKGVPAAMFTSLVRTMLRVESLHSQEPHIILKRVNEILLQDLWQAELFVTAFVAIFDVENRVLMFANAGHTPAIIYHAQSQTSRLLKATSLPIGIAGYDRKSTQYVHLFSGDTLVLYTDGISETPNPAGEHFGIQRIQQLIHKYHHLTPNAMKRSILHDLANFAQSDEVSDDMSLLIVKFEQEDISVTPATPVDILRTEPFDYPSDTAVLNQISAQVTDVCRSLDALPDTPKGADFVYLVELAVSEICTNIIKHAYADTTGRISGQFSIMANGIQIDIYDQGYGFEPDKVPPPISNPMDPSEGGYGLHIVRQIMDVSEYTMNTVQGNHWRLIKYITLHNDE